jgi:hypothetical protein
MADADALKQETTGEEDARKESEMEDDEAHAVTGNNSAKTAKMKGKQSSKG